MRWNTNEKKVKILYFLFINYGISFTSYSLSLVWLGVVGSRVEYFCASRFKSSRSWKQLKPLFFHHLSTLKLEISPDYIVPELSKQKLFYDRLVIHNCFIQFRMCSSRGCDPSYLSSFSSSSFLLTTGRDHMTHL